METGTVPQVKDKPQPPKWTLCCSSPSINFLHTSASSWEESESWRKPPLWAMRHCQTQAQSAPTGDHHHDNAAVDTLYSTSKLPVQSWTEYMLLKFTQWNWRKTFKIIIFLCLALSNPNILKTISNSSRVISEKTSFRRTDPDVAVQSLSLTVFGNVTLENILCKLYQFVKSDIF